MFYSAASAASEILSVLQCSLIYCTHCICASVMSILEQDYRLDGRCKMLLDLFYTDLSKISSWLNYPSWFKDL